MFRRYSHGHSALLGFLFGLALYRHALVYGVLCFAAGLVAGRAWAFWHDAALALRAKVLRARSERMPAGPAAVYPLRGRGGQSDRIPFGDDDE